MDDCDFIEHVYTQPPELLDNPTDYNSDEEGTQPLMVSSTCKCHQYDERAGTESLLSSNRSQNSDLSTTDSKKDESGSCSSSSVSIFNKCSSTSDYDGKIKLEEGKDDDKRVSNRSRSKVARSLAKALFTRDDVTENGSHASESDRVVDVIQLTTCDNETALDLGELSEENALEFVDKFLKINVWDPELEYIPKKTIDQTVGFDAITKGQTTLAQKASCRNAHLGGLAFDWNDMKEDESGGEFFVKNKEVLVGTRSGVGKCGTESQKFVIDESRVSQSLVKFRNVKEEKKIHCKMMNFVHSDSKLVKCGQNCQLEVKSNASVDSNFSIEKQKNERKRSVTAKVKKSSVKNRPHFSKSDTCNSSKQTKQMSVKSSREGSVASRTRSRYVIEEFKIDVLKPSCKEHLQGRICPSTEVKGGRNSRKCRNRSGLAHETSEAGVAKSNLTGITENINVDMSVDRVTNIPHSLKQVGRNRKKDKVWSPSPNALSLVCVEEEYFDSSFSKMLLLKTELRKLCSNEHRGSSFAFKGLRHRSDNGDVRVLFCRHIDEDVIEQQKKIIPQLGVSVASSISDATHFVADAFVCTRNMLEAIAGGKPVVTRFWLESCGRVGHLVDERNYILRDVKIERQLGFSMPFSLARATRLPLLQGKRVLVTPHVKPAIDIILRLVKAVHGQATKRLCRTMSESKRLLSDLLVLSSEEDFEDCVPLLEKGIAIYSSDLLVNGIITQNLDYERYRIFMDHVKETRSTLWVKKDGGRFLPCKRKKFSSSLG